MRMSEFIREEFDAHYLVAEKIADMPEILTQAWERARAAVMRLPCGEIGAMKSRPLEVTSKAGRRGERMTRATRRIVAAALLVARSGWRKRADGAPRSARPGGAAAGKHARRDGRPEARRSPSISRAKHTRGGLAVAVSAQQALGRAGAKLTVGPAGDANPKKVAGPARLRSQDRHSPEARRRTASTTCAAISPTTPTPSNSASSFAKIKRST